MIDKGMVAFLRRMLPYNSLNLLDLREQLVVECEFFVDNSRV